MVPVFEPLAKARALAESTPSSFADFPPWTRGDDSESESEPRAGRQEMKRKAEGFRSRSRRRRDISKSSRERDSGNDTSRSSAHSIFNRGFLKQLLEPVVNNLVDGKGGDASDDKGHHSDDSGHDTDDAHSSAYKGSPPETAEPPSVGPPTSYPTHDAPPPPPPPPQMSSGTKFTTMPSAAPPSPTGVQMPKNPPPVNNADRKPSPSSTIYEGSQSSSMTPSSMMAESRTSVPIAAPTPNPSVGLVTLLTPLITAPIPALSSGARKGVEGPATEVPIVSVSKQAQYTSSSTSAYSFQTPDADHQTKDYRPHPHDDLPPSTEKALIAVGSVGATITVFFVFWLVWKCFKIRRRNGGSRNWRPGFSPSRSLEKPKQVMMNIASRVPVLKKRLANRSWTSLDKPADDAYWEKKLPEPDVRLTSPNGITVHTAISTRSEYEEPKAASVRGHVPNQSISSTQAQFNQTLRSNYLAAHNRMSDISSLSSGFGDGDIIVPHANMNTTITAAPLEAPPPVAQRSSVSGTSQRRDTVYTEASEDPQPRFRTVNSWVRQQTGRVKRAKQREMAASDAPPVPNMPPEQEFRLMMPDGEEPRRVDGLAGANEEGVAR